MKRIVAGIFLISSLLGCGGGSNSDDTQASSCDGLNFRITGGVTCDENKSSVALLVGLNSDGSEYACSGTVITPNKILTAAHCIPGNLVSLTVSVGGQDVAVSGTAVHPRYNGVAGNSSDVGIVQTATTLLARPIPLLLSKGLSIGDSVTAYGYGKQDSSPDPLREDQLQLKAASLTISDFDLGFIVTEKADNGNGICQGDSGGPLSAEHGGRSGIIGVSSVVTGCAPGSFDFFVDLQNSDILSFINRIAPEADAI